MKNPRLHDKLVWDTAQNGSIEGLLAFTHAQEDCLVGCRGRAEWYHGYRSRLRVYKAACEQEQVWSMCTFDQKLFLIQDRSVTVHDMNGSQTSYLASYILPTCEDIAFSNSQVTCNRKTDYFRTATQQKTCVEAGSWALRACLALTQDTLVLVDWKNGRIVEYKLSDQAIKVLVTGLMLPWSIAKQGEGNDRRYFLIETEEHFVRVYSHTWQLVHSIGGFGKADGELRWPKDLAITDEGTILVADAGNWRVSEFSLDGSFLRHRLISKHLREGKPYRLSITGNILWVNVADDAARREMLLKFEVPKFYN